MSPSVPRGLSRALASDCVRIGFSRPGPLRLRLWFLGYKVRWGRDGDGLDMNRQKIDSGLGVYPFLFWSPSFSGLLLDPAHHVPPELVVSDSALSWCWEPTETPQMSTLFLTTQGWLEGNGHRTFHRGGSEPTSVLQFGLRNCRPYEASNDLSVTKECAHSPCSCSSQFVVVDRRGWGCSSPSLRVLRELHAQQRNSQAG